MYVKKKKEEQRTLIKQNWKWVLINRTWYKWEGDHLDQVIKEIKENSIFITKARGRPGSSLRREREREV